MGKTEPSARRTIAFQTVVMYVTDAPLRDLESTADLARLAEAQGCLRLSSLKPRIDRQLDRNTAPIPNSFRRFRDHVGYRAETGFASNRFLVTTAVPHRSLQDLHHGKRGCCGALRPGSASPFARRIDETPDGTFRLNCDGYWRSRPDRQSMLTCAPCAMSRAFHVPSAAQQPSGIAIG